MIGVIKKYVFKWIKRLLTLIFDGRKQEENEKEKWQN